jgi:hypothetical protein
MSQNRQQLSVEEDNGVSSSSNPFFSHNRHDTYSSSNYYTDRQNLPIQRLAIESYRTFKKWIFSRGWFGLLSITVISILLVHWSFLREKRRHQQQQHDIRSNPFYSFIRSFFPSPVLEFWDSVTSLWLHLSVFLESVMKLRLQIKTKSRQGREARIVVPDQTALQRRVFPASLPQLEDTAEEDSKHGIHTNNSQVIRTPDSDESAQHSLVELQPAFLNPSLYPPGWLTYHPVFGLMDIEDFNRMKDIPLSATHVVTINDIR